MTWRDAVAPLRQRSFAWFYASRVVNLLGITMAGVALAFGVLELTGSAADLGLVLAAHTVPLIGFLLVGGVVADRLPRTLVIRTAYVGSALGQGVMATLFLTDTATIGWLMVLSAITGTMSAISFPAVAAMTPQLVDRTSLQQANALISMARGGLTILGPTVAALLVVTVGPGWALAVDGLAWALAAALLLPVRLPPRPPAPEGGRPSHVAELREGWTLFRTTPWLWQVVLGFALLNAIHSGAWLTVGPAQALETIGARGWGLVLSAESVGLLLMTAVLLRVPLQRPLLWGMAAIAAFGVPLVLLGGAAHLPVLMAAAVLAGAGFEVFNMGWNLAMQEHIDERQLSRAFSYDALGSFAAMPLGQLLFGPLGEHVGYGPVLVTAGIVWMVVCGLVLLSPAVRRLPRATETQATGSTYVVAD
ncbi:MFS transporter [Nocardioides sp. HDW12B]|uniref:MFS transporter n=1 Tax=Nocardioides sp. HDW12B TaxID=2714939 RepID=UPI00140BE860|nr:MFS transporter [Nocardioides sp. HDW12B]QIK65689.1 MFS transporter [Nocardioides sp. HDW12B]